jgi:hypothetical protein
MKVTLITVRILAAIVIGVIAFVLGSFAPLWTMMAIGRDPGDIGGGLLTMGIGLPVGVVCGIVAGWCFFAGSRPSKGA